MKKPGRTPCGAPTAGSKFGLTPSARRAYHAGHSAYKTPSVLLDVPAVVKLHSGRDVAPTLDHLRWLLRSRSKPSVANWLRQFTTSRKNPGGGRVPGYGGHLDQGTNVLGNTGLTGHARGVTVTRMSTPKERPSTRRVVAAVAAAGQSGILAADIAAQFMDGTRHPQDVRVWVNTLLSRKKREGYVRRSKTRERPLGLSGQTSYRWFITDKGIRHLNPEPKPDITPLSEPPNSKRVLELLSAAGEKGMTGPVIGRHFTLDYDNYVHLPSTDNLQRRLNWSNQILHRFLSRGYVERGLAETSPFYHNVPAYRWYITDKGREYLDGGMAHGRRLRREAVIREKVNQNRQRRVRADALITQAYVDYDPRTTPQCVREVAIRRLREAGCTLDAIGGVFGLTRERVRQILVGIGVRACRCPKHDKNYSGVGWPV